MGLNCTFMELKFRITDGQNVSAVRLNCTFMELKLTLKLFNRLPKLGLNCTFMELKFKTVLGILRSTGRA